MDDAVKVVIAKIDSKLETLQQEINALKYTKAILSKQFADEQARMFESPYPQPDKALKDVLGFHLITPEQQKPTRKTEIMAFLKKHGPASRKRIGEATSIPEGSIAYVMRDQDTFVQRQDGLWDLTDEKKLGWLEDPEPDGVGEDLSKLSRF